MTNYNNHIITAGDKNFFLCFLQFIYSFERHNQFNNCNLIYFDLGLNEEQRKVVDLKAAGLSWLEVRTFDFSKHPQHYAPHLENYAWKPTLIHEVFEEKKGNILYLDSANIILKDLKPIWDYIEKNGCYTPIAGAGTLSEYTLQGTLDYLNVPEKFFEERNRAGNTCGFSFQHKAVRELIIRWKDLARVKECISPVGANRDNHKSDQSILTILLLEQQDSGTLTLTNDEVDISSSQPIKYISVRKKVNEKTLLPIGFWTYNYAKIERAIDILINKLLGN